MNFLPPKIDLILVEIGPQRTPSIESDAKWQSQFLRD